MIVIICVDVYEYNEMGDDYNRYRQCQDNVESNGRYVEIESFLRVVPP